MKEKKPRWTKSSIISRIQELHAQGVQMSDIAIRKDKSLYAATINHFKSTRRAVTAAGLEYQSAQQIWSKERVIERLHFAHSEGIPMTSVAIHAYDSSLHTACYTYYKSPYEAVLAAGLTPEWTPRVKKVRQPIVIPVVEPVKPVAIRYNPFEQAFDQHRPNRGVVLNSIASPLGMSEAQRMQQGG